VTISHARVAQSKVPPRHSRLLSIRNHVWRTHVRQYPSGRRFHLDLFPSFPSLRSFQNWRPRNCGTSLKRRCLLNFPRKARWCGQGHTWPNREGQIYCRAWLWGTYARNILTCSIIFSSNLTRTCIPMHSSSAWKDYLKRKKKRT